METDASLQIDMEEADIFFLAKEVIKNIINSWKKLLITSTITCELQQKLNNHY